MKTIRIEVQRVAYFSEEIEIEVADDATEEEIAEAAENYARENVTFTDETGADYVVGDFEVVTE